MLIKLRKITLYLLLNLVKWMLFSQRLFPRLFPIEDVDFTFISDLVAQESQSTSSLTRQHDGEVATEILNPDYVTLIKQSDLHICHIRVIVPFNHLTHRVKVSE